MKKLILLTIAIISMITMNCSSDVNPMSTTDTLYIVDELLETKIDTIITEKLIVLEGDTIIVSDTVIETEEEIKKDINDEINEDIYNDISYISSDTNIIGEIFDTTFTFIKSINEITIEINKDGEEFELYIYDGYKRFFNNKASTYIGYDDYIHIETEFEQDFIYKITTYFLDSNQIKSLSSIQLFDNTDEDDIIEYIYKYDIKNGFLSTQSIIEDNVTFIDRYIRFETTDSIKKIKLNKKNLVVDYNSDGDIQRAYDDDGDIPFSTDDEIIDLEYRIKNDALPMLKL